MKNSEFRTPLLQSCILLVALIFIISLIPAGNGSVAGATIGSGISGIFKFFLFLIALALGIGVSIVVMIGIFIAAISLHSPDKAGEIYRQTKLRFAALLQNAVTCSAAAKTPAENMAPATPVDTGISQEEYDQMKSKISSLQNVNNQLQSDVSALNSKNTKLQDDLHSLATMVDELKESETKIRELIGELSAKVKEEPDSELQGQIGKLEEMVKKTNQSITDLAGRLDALEDAATAPSSGDQNGGIFTYITNEEQRELFVTKVQEGVTNDLTYAQFDEFLGDALPEELAKIIKDHPSLTKDYIRSMRK
ncbi:MAG: hypothetical protein ACK5PS_11425 [Desulfopila sp.]